MSTWALVGPPNAGKTTLYNWLTGANAKIVNYPGATVEYSAGLVRSVLREKYQLPAIQIIDTPGIYSLNPQSVDEKITFNILFGSDSAYPLDGIIVVGDGLQLQRHLVLAQQIKDSGYPVIFAVTMMDLLEREGLKLDVKVLQDIMGFPIIQFDGLLGRGLENILQHTRETRAKISPLCPPTWSVKDQEARLKEARHRAQHVMKTTKKSSSGVLRRTQWADSFLLHSVAGYFFFFLIMTLLFASVFWLASPFMDLIDQLFSHATDLLTENIPGLWGNFLGEGLLKALGGVIIFVPQIFILFLGIGLLESTGYLARVGALVDRPLAAAGLGGRSFVPLLSGFACAIPAVMATRNITSQRERFIAQMIIPFMTCSARLPVYVLMISFLLGDDHPIKAGLILALMYFGALLVGFVAARILSKILRSENRSHLLMELPLYRRPRLRILVWQALTKSKSFIFRAGPIIAILALLLWFGTSFPRLDNGNSALLTAQQSYASQLGQKIEPLFKPLGVDWRVGFGLISAFAAREAFVSALALSLNVTEDGEAQNKSLLSAMKSATHPDGTPLFTVATTIGILIFFMIALQCISTVTIIQHETKSWRIALTQLILSNAVAYALAALAVNTLKYF